MRKRLLGVLLMAALAFLVAAPALAVEAGDEELDVEAHEPPSYDEIGTGSEISQEFRPEPYEPPSLFRGMLYPLLVVAGLAVLIVLGLYLWWQPRFAEEREAKKRR